MDPDFSIVSSATSTCDANDNYIVNYSITVTNTGSITGPVDFVEETYDINLDGLSITPTNINLSGSLGSGVITWPSSSFTGGQSKTYRYRLTLPGNTSLTSLASQSAVQFDSGLSEDNTSSFDLNRTVICQSSVLPDAAIFFADNSLNFASAFILLGISFYLLSYFKAKQQLLNFSNDIKEYKFARKMRNFEKSVANRVRSNR